MAIYFTDENVMSWSYILFQVVCEMKTKQQQKTQILTSFLAQVILPKVLVKI